jgi:hypothetical protein
VGHHIHDLLALAVLGKQAIAQLGSFHFLSPRDLMGSSYPAESTIATYQVPFYSQNRRVETLLPGEMTVELVKMNKTRANFSAPLQLIYNKFPSFSSSVVI